MQKSVLSDQDIEAGKALVEKLDALGIPPEKAYWLPDTNGTWYLNLHSTEYAKVGIKKIQNKILAITGGNPDIASVLDLSNVRFPRMPDAFLNAAYMIGTEPGSINEIRVENGTFHDLSGRFGVLVIPEMYLYR